MGRARTVAFAAVLAGFGAWTGGAQAVNLVLDYSYDTSTFFSTNTVNGLKARATLQAAANFFSQALQDQLARIQSPAEYRNNRGGYYRLSWSLNFNHPSTDELVTIENPTVAADEFRLYVGGQLLGGTTLGHGGPSWGSYARSYDRITQQELDQQQATYEAFTAAVINRQQGSGFGAPGGSITFDTDSSWWLDHTIAPAGGTNDLYSVALHEIAHTLGFGTATVGDVELWDSLVVGTSFNGAAAKAVYGGLVPLEPGNPVGSDLAHWRDGTVSKIWGTGINQETAMDPVIFTGSRKVMTVLDMAGLTDIGWIVPEPVSLLLLAAGSAVLCLRRPAA